MKPIFIAFHRKCLPFPMQLIACEKWQSFNCCGIRIDWQCGKFRIAAPLSRSIKNGTLFCYVKKASVRYSIRSVHWITTALFAVTMFFIWFSIVLSVCVNQSIDAFGIRSNDSVIRCIFFRLFRNKNKSNWWEYFCFPIISRNHRQSWRH